jgi:hypothetical protein
MASASALACSLIRRGAGANGQGVNPLARQIAQRLVDQPLAQARNPGKGSALDLHGEVRSAGADTIRCRCGWPNR